MGQRPKGCERKGTRGVAALHRRSVQPYRRLYAAHLYWGAARVVARGGAMPIGGLQPASRRLLFRRVGSARRSMRDVTPSRPGAAARGSARPRIFHLAIGSRYVIGSRLFPVAFVSQLSFPSTALAGSSLPSRGSARWMNINFHMEAEDRMIFDFPRWIC